MINRTSDPLKEIAHHLARSLYSADGAEAARLLLASGLLGGAESSGIHRRDDPEPDAARTNGSIGIWKQKTSGDRGQYHRVPAMSNEWHFWANVGLINPKKQKRRVVFLGESVARGYLYDPEFTPASALEHLLRGASGSDEFEVIDLARTNLGIGIKDLAISARELEPDVVVIFAGNNWSYPEISKSLASMSLLSGGIAGLRNTLAESIQNAARDIVTNVTRFYQSEHTPVIWVVPEFNLRDWVEPECLPPHNLAGLTPEWMRLCRAAEEALCQGDFLQVREHASAMSKIDLGLSTKTLYLLAECSLRDGSFTEARSHLEAARDALIWDCSRFVSPRALTPVQNELRAAENGVGCAVVDLPRVIERAFNDQLPDRSVFLDYCHMTFKGIQIAMASTACSVLLALGGPNCSSTEIMKYSLDPPSRVKGEAAFLAAIHNAHWSQSFELVRYFCGEALRQDLSVARVMSQYLTLQNSRIPALMSRSGAEIAESGSSLIQHYILRYNDQQLDEVLMEAIVESLYAVGIGVREHLENIRQREHSVTVQAVDLLDPYYRSTTSHQQESIWSRDRSANGRTRPNFYRAYSLTSRFTFAGEADRRVTLVITLRLPPGSPRSAVSFSINDQMQTSIDSDPNWSRWEIAVPSEVIRNGLNHVAIGWPMPCFVGHRGIEEAARAISLGTTPEFYQSFGEIFEFLAGDSPVGGLSC